jgi:NADH dehydrogenase FAD-containing subunit
LLPEVVGGDMQPRTVVNPVRRIIPQAEFLSGRLDHVDGAAKRVVINRMNGRKLVLPCDQLIVAMFLEPKLDFAPGMMNSPIPSILWEMRYISANGSLT